jgi:type I restriction enzyme, S subunit
MSENQQEWEISSIGEYCITSSGGTPNRSDPLAYGGDIPWVKSGEVASSDIWATEEHITPHGLNSSSAKIAEEGSILVAMYGATAGQVARLKISAATNQAILAIRPKSGALDSDFLYHFIHRSKDALLATCQGSGQPNLSAGIIRDLEIAIPPLTEQKKIAEILSGIDHTINKLQDQITKETTLANAVSGDLISGRISHCGHKMSDFGPIPANWEIKKLDECLDLYNHQSKTDGEHEVLTSASKGLMRQSEYYGANRITRRDSTGFNIIPNGYLTYRSRSDSNSFYFNRNDLGITGLVSKYYPVFCPKEGTQGGNFFSLLLNHYAPLLSRESVGTSQVVLSFNALKRVALPIPPPSEQLWISRAIASLKDAIKKEDMKIMSLIELKSSLSSDLLSGRKRVSV